MAAPFSLPADVVETGPEEAASGQQDIDDRYKSFSPIQQPCHQARSGVRDRLSRLRDRGMERNAKNMPLSLRSSRKAMSS